MNSLEKKMTAKIYRLLVMLSDNGPDLREPYSRHISDGIFELCIKFSSDITRILYFFFRNQHIILTHGFIKKTPETPPSKIAKAKAYRKEYFKRSDET